jgi:hypothetical protein
MKEYIPLGVLALLSYLALGVANVYVSSTMHITSGTRWQYIRGNWTSTLRMLFLWPKDL